MKRTLFGILGLGVLLGVLALAQPVTNSITAAVSQQLQFVLTSTNLTVRGGAYTLTLAPVDEAAIAARVRAQVLSSLTNMSFSLTGQMTAPLTGAVKVNP